MSTPKAVGIDLGTTFSVVAWVNDQGRTEVIRNTEDEILTPSIVLFEDAEVIVGKEARNALGANPERVADFVKRDMGAPIYGRPIRGEFLPPEVIQACVLRKLKTSIVKELGPETRVVITVPAYFDEPRRKATADAGEMAGLSLLDIVNEPTAAALSFGETLGYLSAEGVATEEMTIFVYDLGGGTFDATLLRLSPGEVRALATDGDVQLGGHDWDLRLVHHVAEEFKQRFGADPREDLGAFNRLYSAVTEAKYALTARTRATVRVDFAGHTADVPVTRELFEELTADLLERTAYTSRQMLAAAGMQWSDVSRVLLVGGATRMPMVQRMLAEMTGIIPDQTVNPDEAVARGAALYAHYLLAKQGASAAGPTFEVVNVNAHSLGVEGIDPQTLRKINVVLIPRNTALPTKVTEKFTTKAESQRSIAVKVLEGENASPSECTLIGRTSIRDLPTGLPKGWPIEVTFEYATNGRLSVHAIVPGTHREVSLDLERDSGMSGDKVSHWRQTMAGWGGFVDFQAMLQEVLAPENKATGPVSAPPADRDPSPAHPEATPPVSIAPPTPVRPPAVESPRSTPPPSAPWPRPIPAAPSQQTQDWRSPASIPSPPPGMAEPPGMAGASSELTQDFSAPKPVTPPAPYWPQPPQRTSPPGQDLSPTNTYLPNPSQPPAAQPWQDDFATGQYLPNSAQFPGPQQNWAEDHNAPTGQYLPNPPQPAPEYARPPAAPPPPNPYYSQPMSLDQYMAGAGMPPQPQQQFPQSFPQQPQQSYPSYPHPGAPGHPLPLGYPPQPGGEPQPNNYREPFGVNSDYGNRPSILGGRFSSLRIPLWVVTVIGYILSAVVGITVGYLLISWLLPDSNLNLFR